MASKEYDFCAICRRNHDQGRKHIFMKFHRQKLTETLKRFTAKVKSARQFLHKPSVFDGELEPDATMWCYCCEQEINKHVTDGWLTVEWGGLLEHMASKTHHKKTRHFWWQHGADRNQLQNMLLFDQELQNFKKKVVKAMDELEESKSKTLQEAAKNTKILNHCAHESGFESPSIRNHTQERPQFSACATAPIPVPSLSVCNDESLTTFSKASKQFVGNVHTGATPPWLLENDEEEETDKPNLLIGPSFQEFLEHKERQSRSKLNPGRVGAEFQKELRISGQLGVDDEDWLPSFGRVWNYGPRSHSKIEFHQISSKKPHVHFIQSSPSKYSMSNTNLPLADFNSTETKEQIVFPKPQPYIRKRPLK